MMNSSEYTLVNTPDLVKAMCNYLTPLKGCIAVDTECDSANSLTAQILGISLSMVAGEAFYVPLATFDGTTYTKVENFEDIQSRLYDLLAKSGKNVLMFNSAYDIIVIRRNLNIDLLPVLHADVILMKHLLDEEKPHRLKDTAVKYLGPEWIQGQDELKASVIANGGRWTADYRDMYKADISVLSKYACADADMTLRLFILFEPQLIDQNLHSFFYKEEVMPLNKIVVQMHERGLLVDIDYYAILKEELSKELTTTEEAIHADLLTTYPDMYKTIESNMLEKTFPLKTGGLLFEEMYKQAGYPLVYNPKTGSATFNRKVIESSLADDPTSNLLLWRLGQITDEVFAKKEKDTIFKARKELFLSTKQSKYVVNILSNDQLGEILFVHLKELATKQTLKGKNKVDDDVLQSFAEKYKFVELILHLRKTNKILSTYVDAALTQNINGIIHPSWLQFGTTSGRFSSREPNYQNLPRKDIRVKKGIIAREGMVLVGADYSQLEPRCFAHCSNEQELIDAYHKGEDLYGVIAKRIFNLSCEPNEVANKHKDQRQVAKTIALAVTYGAKEWKIGKILKKPAKEAKKIIDKYFEDYQNLEKFILSCHGTVLKTGRVVNETGRVRHLDQILQVKDSTERADVITYRNLLNLSVNFPIQSLAASIVNRAMISMSAKFEDEGIDAYILMQVHDEIIVECPEEDGEKVKATMKECMENTYKLKLPLVAEPKIAKCLAETK